MTQRELLQQALEALDNSLDSIMAEFEDSARLWKNVPTKAAKVAGLRGLVDAHEKAIADIQAELAKPEQAECKPVQPDWYQNPTTEEWYEHPADAQLIEEMLIDKPFAVGDEYEVVACWNGKQKFRVVKVEGDDSDDIEVELVESSPTIFTAPPAPAHTEADVRAILAAASFQFGRSGRRTEFESTVRKTLGVPAP